MYSYTLATTPQHTDKMEEAALTLQCLVPASRDASNDAETGK